MLKNVDMKKEIFKWIDGNIRKHFESAITHDGLEKVEIRVITDNPSRWVGEYGHVATIDVDDPQHPDFFSDDCVRELYRAIFKGNSTMIVDVIYISEEYDSEDYRTVGLITFITKNATLYPNKGVAYLPKCDNFFDYTSSYWYRRTQTERIKKYLHDPNVLGFTPNASGIPEALRKGDDIYEEN